MNTANKPMPLRGSTSAPKFDGTPLSLMRYFEDVQQTCETHGITDEAQIVK